jgi:hypothetical protein
VASISISARQSISLKIQSSLIDTANGRNTMKVAAIVLSFAVLVAAIPRVWGADHTEATAESASRAWLALIDSHNYPESWNASSSFFRQRITQSQWQGAAANARAPLGAVISRKLRSATFTHTVPGAPEGEYAIVVFASVFETKGSGVETVTSIVDVDGKWRVAGYYIK